MQVFIHLLFPLLDVQTNILSKNTDWKRNPLSTPIHCSHQHGFKVISKQTKITRSRKCHHFIKISYFSVRERNNIEVTNYCRSKSQITWNSIEMLLKEVLLVPLFKTRINLRKTEGNETEQPYAATSEFSWEVSYLNTNKTIWLPDLGRKVSG